MARIDLLTAQMRQRAVNRASVQSDEKIQLFDAHDQLLGAGAALPHQTIHEILTQIAPGPLDGVPVAFPYKGPDGEFEVSIAPEARGFEIRALSFAPAQSEPLQTHSTPETQSVAPDTSATVAAPPVVDGGWFYLAGDQQLGPHTNAQMKSLIRSGGIRRDTYLWREGMGEWIPVGQSEFHALLPALPNTRGESEESWYYRSLTGQPVPVDKNALVNKIRAGELTGETWVWHQGMPDWESASKTELSSALNARPVGLPPINAGAPIASPTGGPRTLPGSGPYNLYGGGDPENNSGGGEGIEVPKRACGLFNMGAFLFPVFWCQAMGMPSWSTGIVILNVSSRYIPVVGPFLGMAKLPLCIYLGIMGNRMAWRNRRFDSIEDFRRCQLIWGIVSSAIWAVIILAFIVFLAPLVSQVLATAGSTPGRSGQTFNVPQSAGGN